MDRQAPITRPSSDAYRTVTKQQLESYRQISEQNAQFLKELADVRVELREVKTRVALVCTGLGAGIALHIEVAKIMIGG